jgi:hypothetical protein
MTAISETGQKVVLLSKRKFWVFDTNPSITPVCAGDFAKGGNRFQYASKEGKFDVQLPILPKEVKVGKFTCVALSNKYLAIGSQGRLMIFILEGDFAGRWIVSQVFGQDLKTLIERLTFSPDGNLLLALFRDTSGHSKGLILYSKDFHQHDLDRAVPEACPSQEINLDGWEYFRPTGVAFSSGGGLIAMCTSYSGFRAGIQLLARTDSGQWVAEGDLRIVQVFQSNDQREWTGYGFTGISLYLFCKYR